MAAELANEDGQSVLEFLLMFPMMLGLTVMLIRINTAIQISIVDQQYARSQALFLAYNGAWYPELTKDQRLVSTGTNQLIVGVSDNSDSSDSSGSYVPEATTQLITRTSRVHASDDSHTEPQTRAKVRIRDTVTLCTPTLFLASGNGSQPILNLNYGGNPITATGPNTLTEFSRFTNICGSSLQYEQ